MLFFGRAFLPFLSTVDIRARLILLMDGFKDEIFLANLISDILFLEFCYFSFVSVVLPISTDLLTVLSPP